MTTTSERLTITPAAGCLGAVVEGLDLSRPLDDAEVAEVRRLLLEHLVLVFPGQDLDDDAQLRFTLRFGGPYVHPIARAMGQTEVRCGHIVDDVDHPPFQDRYHTDVSWDPHPPTIGTLRMIDRPERGGDTIFSNMYRAYDGLSDVMKGCLDGLTAWHDPGEGKAFRSKSGDAIMDKAQELVPGATHPVVRMHPETGRPILYVNKGFTRSITGMTPNESDALLHCLLEHTTNPNHQMRWHWSVGDVVLWDERCTQHYAVADHYPQRREVARVNVGDPTSW
jgi:taurine dioxygenase